VRPGAPPFFILQGAIDVLVWREENQYFSQRLAEVSEQPVVYWEVPYAQHMFDTLNSRRSCAVVDACESFVNWVVARERARATE
jgi:acetyl esterase/lipase